ncbi:hypothetical protein Pelo_16598 [Pelomyxa schiedti]|nr:hypothetical protein Pelo_16598 [Pelomyxa schiedti]
MSGRGGKAKGKGKAATSASADINNGSAKNKNKSSQRRGGARAQAVADMSDADSSAGEEATRREAGRKRRSVDTTAEKERLVEREIRKSGKGSPKKTKSARPKITLTSYTCTAFRKHPTEIQKGDGRKLKLIHAVIKQFKEREDRDPTLLALHRIAIGKITRKTSIKANLLGFSGLVYGAEMTKESVETSLKACCTSRLQDMCTVLGISAEGSKGDLVKKLVNFLEKPKGSAYRERDPERDKAEKRRKREESQPPPAARKAKKLRISGPITPFILFSQEVRDGMKAQFPSIGPVALAKKISDLWRGMDDQQKQRWETQAEQITGKKAVKERAEIEEEKEKKKKEARLAAITRRRAKRDAKKPAPRPSLTMGKKRIKMPKRK